MIKILTLSRGLQIVDVTPLSLGATITNERMSIIIPRNTSIPCLVKTNYTTADDYQTAVSFRVYEDERRLMKDNILLGDFKLNGIQVELVGVPKFEVTFSIDSDGILSVSAGDKVKLVKNEIKITNRNGHLTQEQIINK